MLHKKLSGGAYDQFQEKIEILRQTVYPKKKVPHLPHNLSKYPDRKSLPRLPAKEELPYATEKSPRDSAPCSSPEKSQKIVVSLQSLKNLEKSDKIGSWTAQSWYPTSKSAAGLKARKPISFREADEIF